MSAILDTSTHLYSWGSFVYGDRRARYRLEPGYKNSVTESAGRSGKRLGESFQDILRVTVSGTLSEDADGENGDVPLRLLVNRLRAAHRAELGKQKLTIHSAADGIPAEYLWALCSNFAPITFESPMVEAEWEASFEAEPEFWWNDEKSKTLFVGSSTTGSTTSGTYTEKTDTLTYVGPTSDYPADAPGLPFITLQVSAVDGDHGLSSDDPAYVRITNTTTGEAFTIYLESAKAIFIDSYEETVRSGDYGDTEPSSAEPYEFLEYDEFPSLEGTSDGAGLVNTFVVRAANCTINSCVMTWFARHW